MFDLITTALSKYALPLLGGVSIILGVMCLFLYSSNRSLSIELGKSQSDLTTLIGVCQEERDKANSIIQSQNTAIEKYRIDITEYTRTINEKEKELIEARLLQQQDVDKELSRDSSADNQLKMVDKILREFSHEGS